MATNGRAFDNSNQLLKHPNGSEAKNGGNSSGQLTITATMSTGSPLPRRRGGSRSGSRPGSGVSLTQVVDSGQSHEDNITATLLTSEQGDANSPRIQTNYSVTANGNSSTIGHISLGAAAKDDVDDVAKKFDQDMSIGKPLPNGIKKPQQKPMTNFNDLPLPKSVDVMVKFCNENNNAIQTLTIPTTYTVADFKQYIRKRYGAALGEMALVCGGKNMENYRKVTEYDIRGTVYMTAQLYGG